LQADYDRLVDEAKVAVRAVGNFVAQKRMAKAAALFDVVYDLIDGAWVASDKARVCRIRLLCI